MGNPLHWKALVLAPALLFWLKCTRKQVLYENKKKRNITKNRMLTVKKNKKGIAFTHQNKAHKQTEWMSEWVHERTIATTRTISF